MRSPARVTTIRRLVPEIVLAGVGLALALSPLSQLGVAAALFVLYGVRIVFLADATARLFFLGFGSIWAVADMVFVHYGVFAYTDTSVVGPPVYMPLIFGQLAVLVGRTVVSFPPDRARPGAGVDLALLGGAAVAATVLHDLAPEALAIAFGVALVVRVAASRVAPGGLLLAAVFGVGEPLLEALLIEAGLFTFAHPGPLGVPVWYWPFFALVSYPISRAFVGAAAWSRRPMHHAGSTASRVATAETP